MPTAGATDDRGRLTSNKFNTSYRVTYTAHLGRPSVTGFTSNQRPAIFYRPSLDHIDNPRFGLLLSDSFVTQTKRHYQPPIRSSSLRSLPNVVNNPRESGFYQLRNHPQTETAEKKTEYQRLFVPYHLTSTAPQNYVTVGPKGESGFTEGTDLQLNTFQEKKGCTVEPRQTLNSMTNNDFLPPLFLQGTEATPSLRSRSSRETGFTRGTVAPLACPTSLLPSHQTKVNTATEIMIGKKEPSGSLINAPNKQAFPNAPFDCSHFNTHYKSMFCRHTDFEKLRSGRTGAGIISSKMSNGYNRRDMDRFIFRD
ncbi:protein phosphatase 1 regulatory subunit 32 [Scomber japonicus]|uniref:protein phosphatase 1 regulatory subunit 32 n=1 Tax=Scomber japonicus TaxID=13676 RepID=UPI002306C21C|nr:protein phosphatase 1 regulatory subunit 32 [Scomber japonicus]